MNQQVLENEKMTKALQTIMVEIHDKTSDTYGRPEPQQNENSAIRWFRTLMEKNDMMKDHPKDFNLILCGYWNPITGQMQGTETEVLFEGKIIQGERNGKN